MVLVIALVVAVLAAALLVTAVLGKSNKKPLDIPSFDGKHLFITGASSGIGLAIARRALLEGAYVTLSARNESKLSKATESLLQELQCDRERVRAAVADVGEHAAISKAVKDAFAWRPIDVLVCNAGLTRAGYTDELPIEVLEEQVQTNLMGVIYTVHAALPLMKRRKTGGKTSIVVVSSAAALFLLYGSAAYTATKHALKGFAECLRLELLPYSINVNLICPGFVNTALLDSVDKEGEFDELLKKLNLYDRGKVHTPDRIAQCTLNAVRSGRFLVVASRAFFPLVALSRGLLAPGTIGEAFVEAFWLPLFRLLTFKMTKDMEKEVLAHHAKKHRQQQQPIKG